MNRSFVPAAGFDFLLPLYDPLWRLMGGRGIRETFIRESGLAAGQTILDIGCGTGSLPIQIAESVPGTRVHALDPDPKALVRCKSKASRAAASILWRQGFGDALPFEDATFERVVSTFMLHHLDLDVKLGMLREARRVLKSDGELHLVDFGRQDSGKDGVLAGLLHSHEKLAENLGGRIGELFREAGFDDVAEVSQNKTIFGRYVHVRGVAH